MSCWKHAIVRVWLGNPTAGGTYRGTAFLVADDRLITAKHVILQDGNPLPADKLYLQGPPWSGVRSIRHIEPHTERDIAALTLHEARSGVKTILPAEVDLKDGDTVVAAGYGTPDKDLDTPPITVSSYDGKHHTFVCHTHVAPGLSGGPALLNGRLVGIVQARDTNRNRTYIIPLDTFQEFIPREGVNPLLEGIASLPDDYANRIERFLTLYLGNPGDAVPFGGREDDLKRLNNWLDDDKQPPRLLLAAPAGRGKSTLLVRWIDQLLRRSDVAVAFVPVSIRFNINRASVVFSCLVARLAALYDVRIPTDPNVTLGYWRKLLADLLAQSLPNGRQLLIVLDGVDEAIDWAADENLLRSNLPSKIRVVLSARFLTRDVDASGWLGRLGWDRIGAIAPKLGALTLSSVADVLTQTGVPLDPPRAKVDIVSQLHRLSEGDPLLLHLYVDDLWDRHSGTMRQQPENLQAIPAGLKAYFDRWWKNQESQWQGKNPFDSDAIDDLFNVLSCAMGPLKHDDLLRLMKPELRLSSPKLRLAMGPLDRLVVGDGRGQGFAFSHPRLGEYFYDELSQDKRRDLEERFLKWGTEILEKLNVGQLTPKEAPVYVIQYYSAHLARSGSNRENFNKLVSEGWHRAWYEMEKNYAGFVNDVRQVWKIAKDADADFAERGMQCLYLGTGIRCAICEASIHSLGGNIPPALIFALVNNEAWNPMEGLAYSRQATNTQQKIEALSALTPFLARDEKEDVLKEVFDLSRSIGDGEYRSNALANLAPHLSPEQLKEALSLTSHCEPGNIRTRALINLAPFLSREQLKEVLSWPWNIENGDWRAVILSNLVPHLIPEDLYEKLAAARSIGDVGRTGGSSRALALAELIPHLSPDEQETVLQEVLSAARTNEDDDSRADFLTYIARHCQAEYQDMVVQEALSAIHSIERSDWRAELLANLAPHLPSEQLQEALLLILSLKSWQIDWKSFAKLVPHLSPEQLHEAFSDLQSRQDVDVFRSAPRLVFRLVERGNLAQSSFAIRFVNDNKARARALANRARYLTDRGKPKEAIDVARSIENSDYRAKALAHLAPELSSEEQQHVLQEALFAARSIEDSDHRAEILTYIARHFPLDKQENVLMEALSAARSIGDDEYQVRAFAALVPHLPPDEREIVLQEILSLAGLIGDSKNRADVLANLTPHVSLGHLQEMLSLILSIEPSNIRTRALVTLIPHLRPEERKIALQEALTAARSIQGSDDRAKTLTNLAPHLSLNQLQEALTLVYSIWDNRRRAEVLVNIASRLSPAQLQEVLSAARSTEDSHYRAIMLADLVPYLPPEEREIVIKEALTAVCSGEPLNIDNWASDLANLAPHLSPAQLQEARSAARPKRSYDYLKIKVLAVFVPYLQPEEQEIVLQDILSAVRYVPKNPVNYRSLVQILSDVARHFPPEKQELILQEALSAARSIGDDESGSHALANLAPHLSPAQLQEALSAACSFHDRRHVEISLAGLAPQLAAQGDFEKALSLASSITRVHYQANALENIAPHLIDLAKQGNLEEALHLARSIKISHYQAEIMAYIAFASAEQGYPEKALQLARDIEDSRYRAEALANLAPHLTSVQLQKALSLAHSIEDRSDRARVLTNLAPRLAELPQMELYSPWYETLDILSQRTRADLLSDIAALSDVIVHLGGAAAISKTTQTIRDVGRWWP